MVFSRSGRMSLMTVRCLPCFCLALALLVCSVDGFLLLLLHPPALLAECSDGSYLVSLLFLACSCSEVLLCRASQVLSGWKETVGRPFSGLSEIFDWVKLSSSCSTQGPSKTCPVWSSAALRLFVVNVNLRPSLRS